MCMGGPGCSGSKTSKSSGYTPKSRGGGKAPKGSYTPRSARATLGGFGKPTVTNFRFGGR